MNKYGNLEINLKLNNAINVNHVNKLNEWAKKIIEKECMGQDDRDENVMSE